MDDLVAKTPVLFKNEMLQLFPPSQLLYTQNQVESIVKLLKKSKITSLPVQSQEFMLKKCVFSFLCGIEEVEVRPLYSYNMKTCYKQFEQNLTELILRENRTRWLMYDLQELNVWVQSYRALLFQTLCAKLDIECELWVMQYQQVPFIWAVWVIYDHYKRIELYNRFRVQCMPDVQLPSISDVIPQNIYLSNINLQTSANLVQSDEILEQDLGNVANKGISQSTSSSISNQIVKEFWRNNALLAKLNYESSSLTKYDDEKTFIDEVCSSTNKTQSTSSNQFSQAFANDEIQEHELDIVKSSESGYRQSVNRGGQATINKAMLGRKLVALKIPINNDKKAQQQLKREIEINRKIQQNIAFGSNILPYVGYVNLTTQQLDTNTQKKVQALVTPYQICGSLHEVIHDKTYPRESRQVQRLMMVKYVYDVAQGMKQLHEQGIVHLDLNPRNVLISESQRAQIADFGLSADIGKKHSSDGGTIQYMAPERINRQPGMQITVDDKKSDVYSFGMLLYEVLTQKIPWEPFDVLQIQIKVKNGERPPIPEELKKATILVNLMNLCWQQDPNDRPTFEDITQKLEGILKCYI